MSQSYSDDAGEPTQLIKDGDLESISTEVTQAERATMVDDGDVTRLGPVRRGDDDR